MSGWAIYTNGNGARSPQPNVPYVNQGNTRVTKAIVGGTSGVLVNDYNPFIADASVTYMLDSFPFLQWGVS